MPKFTDVKVSLPLPLLGKIEGTWKPDESEREASWEMYVELVTRISVVELGPDEGLLREALSSLYTLFGTTRTIMRQHGPSVARPKGGKGGLSFGYLAVAVLNTVLRPVLAKWHPLLLDYEMSRPEAMSALEHERRWDRNKELRDVLDKTRDILLQYANILAEVAEVPPLVFSPEKK
jgi:hypothetical protein